MIPNIHLVIVIVWQWHYFKKIDFINTKEFVYISFILSLTKTK